MPARSSSRPGRACWRPRRRSRASLPGRPGEAPARRRAARRRRRAGRAPRDRVPRGRTRGVLPCRSAGPAPSARRGRRICSSHSRSSPSTSTMQASAASEAVRSGRRRPGRKLVAARTAARCSAARRAALGTGTFRVARRIRALDADDDRDPVALGDRLAEPTLRHVLGVTPGIFTVSALSRLIRARGRTTIASGRRRGQPDLDTKAAQTPIGCQTVFSSRNAAISYGLCWSALPGPPA